MSGSQAPYPSAPRPLPQRYFKSRRNNVPQETIRQGSVSKFFDRRTTFRKLSTIVAHQLREDRLGAKKEAAKEFDVKAEIARPRSSYEDSA
jgi:hypothetical protein